MTAGRRSGAACCRADVRAVEEANLALYAAVESADLDAMGRLWTDGEHARLGGVRPPGLAARAWAARRCCGPGPW